MNRIDRLFGILLLLQSRRHISAARIAEQYATSVRTVYRDLKALGELGIPIGFEPKKGYGIVPGYFLPPVAFNTHEASALLLMERFLIGFADASIAQHYSSALNKVKNVLKSHQKDAIEMLDDHIKLQIPARLLNPNTAYLASIQTAITAKEILKISYKNNQDELSVRQIEPIGLIFYAFSWHLIAYCHLRLAYRDFKVTAIQHMQALSVPFTIANHIAVNDYMKQLPVDY